MSESKNPAFPGNELALGGRDLAEFLWVKPISYLLRKPDLVHLEHLNIKQLTLVPTSSSVTQIHFLTYLTGAAVDEVAKRSTGGDVSIVFAGVELGDVTVVAGEDWRNILNIHSIHQHFSPTSSCTDAHTLRTKFGHNIFLL